MCLGTPKILFLKKFYLLLWGGWHMWDSTHVAVVRGQLVKWFFSFHLHVDPKRPTELPDLCGEHLHPPSHLVAILPACERSHCFPPSHNLPCHKLLHPSAGCNHPTLSVWEPGTIPHLPSSPVSSHTNGKAAEGPLLTCPPHPQLQ